MENGEKDGERKTDVVERERQRRKHGRRMVLSVQWERNIGDDGEGMDEG